MSRLSDVYSSYGKEFNIGVANTFGDNIIAASKLPPNMIIISSPHDENNEDLGVHSMFATDSYGVPVRLTYSITEGNGLYSENDILSLHINDKYINAYNNKLSLKVSSIVDNTSILFDNGTLRASTEHLQNASKTQYGVSKIDSFTLKSNNKSLYVDTENLDLADNNSNTPGIVKSTNSGAIKISNGVVSINTQSIGISGTNAGIVKGDGLTVISNNGVLSASIDSFNASTYSTFGLAKEDNTSIKLSNEGKIYADFNSLNGLVKVDNVTTVVNNGVLGISSSMSITDALLNIGNQIDNINNRIDIVEERLSEYSPVFTGNAIFSFMCNGLSSVMLIKPKKYGELPEDMPVQYVTAEFMVRTNCPFRIYIDYIDNDTPQVILYEINYNDVDVYSGNLGLARTFQSTDNKDVKIKFSWICKNYRSNNNLEYSKKTKINLEVRCADDASIKKSVKYSILRYNSLYDTSIDFTGQNDEIIINKYKKTNKTNNYTLEIRACGDQSILNGNIANIDTLFWPSYAGDTSIVPKNKSYTLENESSYIYLALVSDDEVIPITTSNNPNLRITSSNGVSATINNGRITLSYNNL